MANKRLFGKISAAAASVKDQAQTSLQQAGEAAGQMLETGKEKAQQVGEAAGQLMETGREKAQFVSENAGLWLEIGREKLVESFEVVLQEVNNLKPILAEGGFIVGDFNVTLPLPPEVMMTVEHVRAGEKTLDEILQERAETLTRLQKLVLQSLLKADELVHVTRRYGYTFCKYDITLTVPPRVTIHMISEKAKHS